jgi:hypothetical protein
MQLRSFLNIEGACDAVFGFLKKSPWDNVEQQSDMDIATARGNEESLHSLFGLVKSCWIHTMALRCFDT